MKISYLVTCHNETQELSNVVWKLKRALWDGAANGGSTGHDEIVVLDDYSDNPETKKILNEYTNPPHGGTGSMWKVKVVQHSLNGDFGAHKTYGSRQCTGDYIVQLDADEYLSQPLLDNMHELLESNPQVELYRVPRVNIVRGMTDEDARKWGWKVYSLPEFPGLPIINWEFDHQARIYKNTEKIKWHKPLHETITGAEYVSVLPLEVDYAIIHDKTIDRQRAQNEFYNKNWSTRANMGQG